MPELELRSVSVNRGGRRETLYGGGFNRSLQHCPKFIGRRFKPQGFPGALV
jgi:hypothetical protein